MTKPTCFGIGPSAMTARSSVVSQAWIRCSTADIGYSTVLHVRVKGAGSFDVVRFSSTFVSFRFAAG